MSHMRFTVQVGERGRLVLPAPVRDELEIGEGDRLLLTVEDDGSVRLVPARTAAARFKGMFSGRYGDRSLVDELIAERRAEAEREASVASR